MRVSPQPLPDVTRIVPTRFHDNRGHFFEAWNRRSYAALGIHFDFVQDSVAFSIRKHTVRGLHFQKPPTAHNKLVWVASGSVLDVVLDIRHGSPTFGQHATALLSAENGAMLLIPIGFAHGYCTLEPNTIVQYKTDACYSAEDDKGIAWDDPSLAIPWPVAGETAELSEKDRNLPRLCDAPAYFAFEGRNG